MTESRKIPIASRRAHRPSGGTAAAFEERQGLRDCAWSEISERQMSQLQPPPLQLTHAVAPLVGTEALQHLVGVAGEEVLDGALRGFLAAEVPVLPDRRFRLSGPAACVGEPTEGLRLGGMPLQPDQDPVTISTLPTDPFGSSPYGPVYEMGQEGVPR
jgi:hypothetical protein